MAQTEFSYFFDGLTLGDADLGAHTSDVMAVIWAILFQENETTQGVINTDHSDFSSKLIVTNPAGNNIRMANGAALIKGRIYTNDANVDTTIVTPTSATRIDRVILRVDFNAQTIRHAILTGFEGASTPILTTNNLIWEIAISQISITTGAVITLIDERDFAIMRLQADVSQTFTLLDTFTSTGVETKVDFSEINQGYKNLKIIGMARHIDNSGVGGETKWAPLGIRINGDSDIVYNSAVDYARVSTAGAGTATAIAEVLQANGNGYYVASDDADANHFSPVLMDILNYAETNFFNQIKIIAGVWGATGGRPSALHKSNVLYKKTASVNRIEIFNIAAPTIAWATGTRFVLLGIK